MTVVKSTDTHRRLPRRPMSGFPSRRGICATLFGSAILLVVSDGVRSLAAQTTDTERRKLEREGNRRLEQREERRLERERTHRQESEDRYRRQEDRRRDFLQRRELDRPEPFPDEPPPRRR